MKQNPYTVSMKLEIDIRLIPEIPLRYYMGWTIVFRPHKEDFCSPILCLYGFSNVKDLEKAIANAVKLRNS